MFLLDTNVVSDAHKGVMEPARWLARADPQAVFLSVVTIGEIERGIELLRQNKNSKATSLQDWLAGLRRDCAERILPVTEEIAIVWGRLMAGRNRGDADALIAATAIVHGLTVATRNVTDFADTGASVVNPWEA